MRRWKEKEDRAKVIHEITHEGVKSIEEMAKLGMPFDILGKKQQVWLLKGGEEFFKEEKPYLYPLIKKMIDNTDRAFPEGENITKLAREVFKRLGWEETRNSLVTSLTDRILRWKMQPYFLRSEMVLAVADKLYEVIKEKYEKDPEGYKYLHKSISEWIKWNRRMRLFREGCKKDDSQRGGEDL